MTRTRSAGRPPGRARDTRTRVTGGLAAGALVLTTLAACGTAGSGAPGAAADELSGTVTVFAAASLTQTFTELGDRLMAAHPGLTVTFGFAGSSGLAAQIASGAPADVFAAASPAAMQTAVDAGATDGDPLVFVRNTLEIAVPTGNPAGVSGITDLTRPDLTIALCAPEVPCGAAAEEVFTSLGLTPSPDTLEQDVKAALTKVELGEVDAALVYRTDVASAAGRVTGIEVPAAATAVNDYPIAVLAAAPNPAGARAFVELVLSAEGRQVFADAGFATP